MTISMSLIVSGAVNVYAAGEHRRRDARSTRDHLASAARPCWASCRTACCCSCRWPSLILFGLRRFGYGRLLYAVGDNETAARLAGVRVGAVLVVLYVHLRLPCRGGRAHLRRRHRQRHRSPRGPVPAAVGRRRGHRRHVHLRRSGRVRRKHRRCRHPHRPRRRCSTSCRRPRHCARSCSARSSSPSPPRTRGSPPKPDPSHGTQRTGPHDSGRQRIGPIAPIV